MSLPRKVCTMMETKRGEQYHPQPSVNSTGILLVEDQVLGIKNGNTVGSMNRQVLVETAPPVLMEVIEGKKSPAGNIIVRGKFGECDKPTANGRIYPRKLMEREISRLQEAIKERSIYMCGTCDHPSDGKTPLLGISHIVTDLSIDSNGEVWGEAEILRKTPAGQALAGLIESGIKVPVSSRGYGSTAPSRKFQGEEVQDDFVLKVYDFVSDPAVRSAIPEVVSEDIDYKVMAEMFMDTFPEIKGVLNEDASDLDASKLRKEIERELSESFERKLKDALVGLKEDVTEQIKEEYSNDPEIGGAKGVLAAIAEMVSAYTQVPSEDSVKDALKASELAVSEANAEKEKYVQLAKKTAYALNLERKISGHAMAESIRKLFEGREFESLELMNEAISSVLKDMHSDVVVPAKEAQLMEENAKLKGEVTLLESKVDDLKDRVERAVKLGERVETQRIEAIEEASSEINRLNALLEEATLTVEEEKSKAKTIKEDADQAVRDAECKVYKLEKVAGFANGRKMLQLMESITDSKVVDAMVEGLGVKGMQDPMLEEMRSRKPKGKASRDNMVFEDYSSDEAIGSVDDLGNSITEMARMAGIPVGKQQLW